MTNTVLKIWVGYKKSGQYIRTGFVMADAVESFIKEFVHTNKEIEVIENGRRSEITEDEKAGEIYVWTNNGYKTVKVK